MKTNVIMFRKMGEFDIQQRTADGYFNATVLVKQWNKSTGQKKEIKEFLSNQSTKEYLQVLEDQLHSNGGNSPYLGTRGNTGATWMHPYLFLDFAMWINPKFKLTVIQFVYDQLIRFRHSAGDNYKTLNKALAKFPNTNYAQVAKALNYLVFGSHNLGLRQQATEEQLHKLSELENQLAFAVDMGFIRTFDDFMNRLRHIWYTQKHQFALHQ